MTTMKDRASLRILLENLIESNDVYICILCGHTMNIHPRRCTKCNSNIEDKL